MSRVAATHRRTVALSSRLGCSPGVRGQELGAVRDNLPMPLMLELIMAVDEVGDNWLLSRWDEVTDQELEDHIEMVVDLVRRMLQPAS